MAVFLCKTERCDHLPVAVHEAYEEIGELFCRGGVQLGILYLEFLAEYLTDHLVLPLQLMLDRLGSGGHAEHGIIDLIVPRFGRVVQKIEVKIEKSVYPRRSVEFSGGRNKGLAVEGGEIIADRDHQVLVPFKMIANELARHPRFVGNRVIGKVGQSRLSQCFKCPQDNLMLAGRWA